MSETASVANYNTLQKKSVALIAASKHILQFLDRDTRPDFASTVMLPALQQFLKSPNDVDGLTKSIEQQSSSLDRWVGPLQARHTVVPSRPSSCR
jgi:multiple sugar transport system substrate-binding protein